MTQNNSTLDVRKMTSSHIGPKASTANNVRLLMKQPNKPVYRALGNPTRGKVTGQKWLLKVT